MTDIGRDLHALRPRLMASVRRLTRDESAAEDIVSQATMQAWAARDRFEEGTRLFAWVFFIARNIFLSQCRKRKWDGGSSDDIVVPVAASQGVAINLADAIKGLSLIPRDQREAVLLVGAGATYEEAAEELCCSLGTVKSRVARGRDALREVLA